MPTYEYRCANGHTFERLQRISDPPIETCPECGAAAERVLSGGGGLLFKGSGFYITDYRSDKYRKAAEAEKPSGQSGGEKSGESGKGSSTSSSGGSAGA